MRSGQKVRPVSPVIVRTEQNNVLNHMKQRMGEAFKEGQTCQ